MADSQITAGEQAFLDEAMTPLREGEEIDVGLGREIPEHMTLSGRHRRDRYWAKRLADGRAKYGDGVWFGVEEGNITIMRTRRSNFKAGRTTHPDGIWECLVVRDEPRLPPEKGMLLYRYLGEGTMPVPATDEFFEFYKEKDPRCVLNDVVYRDIPTPTTPEPVEESPVVVSETVAEPENVVEAPGVQQEVAPVDYVAEPLTPKTPLTTEEFLAKFPAPEPALETVPPEPMLLPEGYEVVDLSPQVAPEVEPEVVPEEPEYTPPVEVTSGLLTAEELAAIQARYIPTEDGTEIDLLPPFGGSPTVYEATPPAPVHTNDEGRNVIPGLEDLM